MTWQCPEVIEKNIKHDPEVGNLSWTYWKQITVKHFILHACIFKCILAPSLIKILDQWTNIILYREDLLQGKEKTHTV